MKDAEKKHQGISAVELIEEAVHLLRRHPRELTGYYATVGPFVVMLIYFWAFVTWFVPNDGAVAAGALGLVFLFGFMKAGQHRFALRLQIRLLEGTLPSWPWRRWPGEIALQLRVHASGALLVPLAAVFAVPFGWIYAYYQNATVMPGTGRDSAARRREAWEQARLWPAQNHLALAIFSALALMVFLNLAVAFYLVPTLATQWFGLKTIFALKGWSYFNSTFLALVTGLTFLAVDPLIKAFYIVRIFHGESRRSGADLRLVLAREKTNLRRLSPVTMLLGLACLGLAHARVLAAEPLPAINESPAISTTVLDRNLDAVLDQPDFRWRLKPLPLPAGEKKEGLVSGFLNSTFDTVARMAKTFFHWLARVRDWFADLFPGAKADPEKPRDSANGENPLAWMNMLSMVAWGLLVVGLGVLIFVAWKIWRQNRGMGPRVLTESVPVGTPDLRDDAVEASRLPFDGWMELARQQVAAGEWRLALRALFLASLARLGHEGLVSLAKFKTNLDYEIELRRRALSRTEEVEDFHLQRRRFEEVWYGAVPVSDSAVRERLEKMERPR